jgi:hypothetical protein
VEKAKAGKGKKIKAKSEKLKAKSRKQTTRPI